MSNPEINTAYIKVTKTARYASWGTLSEKTRYFWFVLHGSNMLCEQMIYKFMEFDPETHFVVAPEGLSRLYKDGFQGDVVALWMTKRDRLHEIADFSEYLSTLYHSYMEKLPAEATKTILGFSQGGTTAYRWLHNTPIKADFLISHSCWIPEDIDFMAQKENFDQIRLIYTYGDQDPYLTDERIEAVKTLMEKNQLAHDVEIFKGKHRIEKLHLNYLFNTYIK